MSLKPRLATSDEFIHIRAFIARRESETKNSREHCNRIIVPKPFGTDRLKDWRQILPDVLTEGSETE